MAATARSSDKSTNGRFYTWALRTGRTALDHLVAHGRRDVPEWVGSAEVDDLGIEPALAQLIERELWDRESRWESR